MIDQNCILCEKQKETRQHLLFECDWTNACLKRLKRCLNWRSSKTDLNDLLRWIQRSRLTEARKKVYISSLAALTYMMWFARNKKLWENEDVAWERVFSQIRYSVKNRIMNLQCKKIKGDDKEWGQNL